MFVAGQRVRHVSFAHDDKGGAIRERPFLVGVLMIKLQRAVQQFARDRNNFTRGGFSQMQNEIANA